MYRKEKIENIIKEQAASFIEINSNRTSLVTVTRVEVSKKFDNATIFFTVFPSDQEKAVCDFLRRQMKDFVLFLKKHTKLNRLPQLVFAIDEGEKNRQRIDEIARQDAKEKLERKK